MGNVERFIERIRQQYSINVSLCTLTEDLFDSNIRKACEANYCGSYGKNWKCPPAVGDIESLVEKTKSYSKIIVFQHISKLEDSFDYEGMVEAKLSFDKAFRAVADEAEKTFGDCLVLGAGGCTFCKECAMKSNEPCRFPQKAYSSLESHGVFVAKLAEKCGLKYINGVNTVTYFGAVFLS